MYRILYLDENKTYLDKKHCATTHNVVIDHICALHEIDRSQNFELYDVAIVDMRIENAAPFDCTEFLTSLFGNIPLLAITSENFDDKILIENKFSDFRHKSQGPDKVIEAAKQLANSRMSKSA